MPDGTAPSASRLSIISAVANPLNFLTLAVLIVEMVLVTSLSDEGRAENLWYLLGPLLLLVFIVCGLAIWRPEALQGVRPFEDLHARSLADDVYHSIDGYLSNLPPAEREEAWQYTVKTLRNVGGRQQSHALWAIVIADQIERRAGPPARTGAPGPIAGS